MKRVITLIPTHTVDLKPLERISVLQCLRVLADHPVALMVPEGLDLSPAKALWEEAGRELEAEFFPVEFFKCGVKFQRLMLDPGFYGRFRDYEFLLICQTDVFIFSDRLEEFCARPWDYWGAPWLEGKADAAEDAALTGVGCGGFSLRRIEPHLRVLQTHGYVRTLGELVQRHLKGERSFQMRLRGARLFLRNLTIGNNFHHRFNTFLEHEDVFWGRFAKRKFDWYRVPSPEEALAFCMEVQPQRMMELNGGELPFAAHAWWRYGLDYWRPYIEGCGHDLSVASGEA